MYLLVNLARISPRSLFKALPNNTEKELQQLHKTLLSNAFIRAQKELKHGFLMLSKSSYRK